MAWKPMGRPTVREQRNKWVVRIDGVDTETGKMRPRQLGTYTSKQATNTAASQYASDGETGGDRRTVGHVVEKWRRSARTRPRQRGRRLGRGRSAQVSRRRQGPSVGSIDPTCRALRPAP